jgi:hypothetical protein
MTSVLPPPNQKDRGLIGLALRSKNELTLVRAGKKVSCIATKSIAVKRGELWERVSASARETIGTLGNHDTAGSITSYDAH